MAAICGDLTIKQLLNELNQKLDQSEQLDDSLSLEREEEITEQIGLAEGVLSKIRSRLNSRRPINRLPVELLASIFLLCQDQEPWSLFPPATKDEMKGVYSWLVLTEVCVQWRRTALSEPCLWAKIYLRLELHLQKEFRDMFAERARSFPLHLHQHLRPEDFGFYHLSQSIEESQAFAKRYSAQLRSLYFSSGGLASISSEFWSIFECQFPQLQDLHLDIDSDNYSVIAHSLRRLLQEEKCSIKRLSLTHIPWPTGPQNLTHLTHLSLRFQAPDLSPSYPDFLDMLKGCSLLRFLSLHDAGPLSVHSETAAGRIITLPSLCRIEISWSDDPAIWSPRQLLGHLNFPNDTAILFHARYMFHNDYFAGVLANLPPQKYLDRISTVQLRKSGDTAILFQGEAMCIDSTVRHDAYLQGLVPHFPNLSTLVFDHPAIVDLTNISMFYAPTHFSKIRFLYPANFIPFIQSLCDPDVGPRCPSPIEILVPSTSVEEMSKRHPLYRTKLKRYHKKEISDVNRAHLNLPQVKLIFEQDTPAEKAPFSGPLRRIIRGI